MAPIIRLSQAELEIMSRGIGTGPPERPTRRRELPGRDLPQRTASRSVMTSVPQGVTHERMESTGRWV
jgi:hypothetical protein